MKATVNCFHAHQNHHLWLALVVSALRNFAGEHPSLGINRRARSFHLYCALAFLSVVITYFGVNFFLGGVHAYM